MKVHIKKFIAPTHKKIKLPEWPTDIKDFCNSPEEYQALLKLAVTRLDTLQQVLYASNHYAVLLIFQGMDGSGKDSAIRHVMSGINPQGCETYSFKQPSHEELEHDFLWRTTCRLPERGHIGIFNRSYYEEVLVVQVHPKLLEKQNLPPSLQKKSKIWQQRYESINNFESHLAQNGTCIVKFFLHLSKEEQKKRFLKRIDQPNKNWKFSLADLEERAFWQNYQQAYEKCLSVTSTKHAPWHIIPADDKENSHLIISIIIQQTLEKLKLDYPKTTRKHAKELRRAKKILLKSP